MPDFDDISSLNTDNNQILHFYGVKTAMIGRSKEEGEVHDNPFFIDGIVVWEANEIQALKQLIFSPGYQQFKEPFRNQIYLFHRVY